MRRVKLIVAYDGTYFHGWQFQPQERTVEGELNRAIKELTGEDACVIGASRTDAGVHAYGAVCVFDTESSIPGEKFSLAINTKLPEDVRVVTSELVGASFHPRYDCHNKTYEYHIKTGYIMPTERLYAWNCWEELDIQAMNEAASHLVGRHDFSSFKAAGSTVTDSVRTIFEASVRKEGQDIIISVTGDGFLYNMVRIIAGTLYKVGAGKMSPSDIPAVLEAKDRSMAGPTAPAKGLFLKNIVYNEEK